MGSMNIYNGTNKASITYSGTSDVSVDATNLSGLTGNVQTQLGTKANTADLKEIGVGQTWQNMTSQRVAGVTYTNTTGKPIMVSVWSTSIVAGFFYHRIYVDTTIVYGSSYSTSAGQANGSVVIVPNGSSYKYENLTNASTGSWSELR